MRTKKSNGDEIGTGAELRETPIYGKDGKP